jgi:hypothetical protein
MEIKNGDKFIIEVKDSAPNAGKTVWFKGGFTIERSMIERFARKLFNLTAYDEGLQDGFDLACKISCNSSEKNNFIFQAHTLPEIQVSMTAKQAMDKYNQFEEESAKPVSVGDECRYRNSKNNFIVTAINDGFFNGIYMDGSTIEDGSLNLILRTGRTFPEMVDILERMKNND